MIQKETQKGWLGHSKLLLANYVFRFILGNNFLICCFICVSFSGYMAPEYASEGLYSIKSDVFSFGVLILEIVIGKRNSGFNQYEDFLNLLGYVSFLHIYLHW